MTKVQKNKQSGMLRVLFAAALVLLLAAAGIGAASAAEAEMHCPSYIEVDSWEELACAISGWSCADQMRTIVLTNTTPDAYKKPSLIGTVEDAEAEDEEELENGTISAAGIISHAPYRGFHVTGYIKIMPAADADEIKIDANQNGRLFRVDGGKLVLAGNGTAKLTLTGGKLCLYDGGAVRVINEGELTVSDNVKITGCSADYGGAVYIADDAKFEMKGGIITGCSANKGGAVYCDADDSILCSSYGCFNVLEDAEITGNTEKGTSKANNVYLESAENLCLKGDFTGSINITNPVEYKGKFGTIKDCASGAENFISDNPEGYKGKTSCKNLVWDVIEYDITYELDGGTNSWKNPETYTIESGKITLHSASKEGYTFEGWYTSSVFTEDNRTAGIPCKSVGDRTFYANYTAIVYSISNVTGTGNHGNVTLNKTEAIINEIVHLEAVPDIGYHFVEWNVTNSTGSQIYVDEFGNFVMPADDVNAGVVFAPNTYTVVFNGNGATGGYMSNQSMTYDLAANLADNGYSKYFYHFIGWNKTSASGIAVDYADAELVQNLTSDYNGTVVLYAVWSLFPAHTISTYTVNGNVTANKTVAFADETIHVTAVSNTGYHFGNWNVTKRTGGQIAVDESGNFIMPPVSVNAGADFVPNTYTIVFDGNGATGGSMGDQQMTYDVSAALASNNYVKEDNYFIGWNKTSGTAVDYNDNQSVKNLVSTDGGSITLYAVWSEDPLYIISTDTENGVVTANKTVAFEGDIIHVTAANNTGYHFVSWNVTDSTGALIDVDEFGNFVMPADKVNAGAVFAPNTYTVVFDGNGETGGSMEDQQMTYDLAANLNRNAYLKAGCTFQGWNATDAFGSEVDYADEEIVINLIAEDGGEVTLFAVWKELPPQPSPSSRNNGASVWLTPTPTPVPTVTPTVEPTANPGLNTTQTPAAGPVNSTTTPASPMPIVGLLAGLAGAAAVAVLRRK